MYLEYSRHQTCPELISYTCCCGSHTAYPAMYRKQMQLTMCHVAALKSVPCTQSLILSFPFLCLAVREMCSHVSIPKFCCQNITLFFGEYINLHGDQGSKITAPSASTGRHCILNSICHLKYSNDGSVCTWKQQKVRN